MPGRVTNLQRLTASGVALALGIVLSLVNSHTLQVIGFILVVGVVFFAVRVGLSARFWDPPDDPSQLEQMGLHREGPDYIEEAETPATDVWARESQRYAEHDAERQRDGD